MKIQCNVCEAAEAKVLCCADEAALCWRCDEEVHAANKLASKHQRVPLSRSSSEMPVCDICQEAVGYFFCLEDRALLCRKCDVSIHTTNNYVSAHQRFLLTGVKVGLEPTEPGPSSSIARLNSAEKNSGTKSQLLSKRVAPVSPTGQGNKANVSGVEETMLTTTKVPLSGGLTTGSISQWQLDEFLELTDFNQTYGFLDHGSPEADSGKLGGSDCSQILRSAELELDMDDCLSQVPESSWMVPELPSPPTSSGLNWSRLASHRAAFVPDISFLPTDRYQPNGSISKRRRQY